MNLKDSEFRELTGYMKANYGINLTEKKLLIEGRLNNVVIEKGFSIIRLLLTLQIIQALLVKVSSETMALSLGYVDRVIDFKEELVKTTNNKVISLLRLSRRLAIDEI